jgi:hypothetical protein
MAERSSTIAQLPSLLLLLPSLNETQMERVGCEDRSTELLLARTSNAGSIGCTCVAFPAGLELRLQSALKALSLRTLHGHYSLLCLHGDVSDHQL